jgi:flagellar biosynthesis protein FliQ
MLCVEDVFPSRYSYMQLTTCVFSFRLHFVPIVIAVLDSFILAVGWIKN